MVDVRAKGAKAETVIRDFLREATGLKWERTPGSGALDEKHGLKGDLYIPQENNIFCIECKHYEEDHISSKLLTSKSPQLMQWWEQAVRQGKQVNRKPLLIFKFNRSKLFVAYNDMPEQNHLYILLNTKDGEIYISLLEDWLKYVKPEFVK